MASVCQNK